LCSAIFLLQCTKKGLYLNYSFRPRASDARLAAVSKGAGGMPRAAIRSMPVPPS
jgi:hypothetical protein